MGNSMEILKKLKIELPCAVLSHSVVSDSFVTPCTIAGQAPLSMAILQAKIRSGLPCPSPGIFLTQELNPCLFCLLYWQAASLLLAPPGEPRVAI